MIEWPMVKDHQHLGLQFSGADFFDLSDITLNSDPGEDK